MNLTGRCGQCREAGFTETVDAGACCWRIGPGNAMALVIPAGQGRCVLSGSIDAWRELVMKAEDVADAALAAEPAGEDSADLPQGENEPFDPGAAFENRAVLDEETGGAQAQACGSCGEAPVFALRAGEGSFSVDLVTILKCVELAAQERCLPPLEGAWWLDVKRQYDF